MSLRDPAGDPGNDIANASVSSCSSSSSAVKHTDRDLRHDAGRGDIGSGGILIEINASLHSTTVVPPGCDSSLLSATPDGVLSLQKADARNRSLGSSFGEAPGSLRISSAGEAGTAQTASSASPRLLPSELSESGSHRSGTHKGRLAILSSSSTGALCSCFVPFLCVLTALRIRSS